MRVWISKSTKKRREGRSRTVGGAREGGHTTILNSTWPVVKLPRLEHKCGAEEQHRHEGEGGCEGTVGGARVGARVGGAAAGART